MTPDDEIELFTRDQALQIARAEARRGYVERDDHISYVTYLPEFHDFCVCEFSPHEGAWVKTFRTLTPGERLPGEEIHDETIIKLATSGDMVSAVRLYRSKHEVGLKEGLDAVQKLLGEGRTR